MEPQYLKIERKGAARLEMSEGAVKVAVHRLRQRYRKLLRRWAIVWLPLFVPMLFVALLIKRAELTAAFIWALVLLLLWICAAVYAVIVPNRGLHDRLAGTWVVRR